MMKALFWALGMAILILKSLRLIPEISWFWVVLIFIVLGISAVYEWYTLIEMVKEDQQIRKNKNWIQKEKEE